MPSTTQILFNAPALHALKRDQLVKLCKLHDLKATGKNAELIERLQQRAAELPPELAAMTDEEEVEDTLSGALSSNTSLRPSEQWEMVMDDIEEVDEENGTLGSKSLQRGKGPTGEFGTNASKSTVTSSLKAFATSLGIKRAGAGKTAMSPLGSAGSSARAVFPSTPSADRIAPNNSPAKAQERSTEPIPGNPSRRGVPAPPNARLSTGSSANAGVTTTIRLISESYGSPMPSPPRLAPHPTTFDLDMGTPGGGANANVWPASPRTGGRLYPAVPYEDLIPTPLTRFVVPDSLPGSVMNSPSPSKMKSKEWQKRIAQITKAEEEPADETAVVLPTPSRVATTKEDAPLSALTPARAAALKQKPIDKPDMFSPAKIPGSTKRPSGRISTSQNEPFLFGSPIPKHNMTNTDFGDAAASVLAEMNKRLAEQGVSKVNEKILSGERKSTDVFSTVDRPGQKKTDGGDRFAKVHDEAFNKMDSIVNHYAAKRVLQPASNAGEVPGTKKRKSDALVAHAGATPAARRRSVAKPVRPARVVNPGPQKKVLPGAFGDDDDDDSEVVVEALGEDAGDRRASKRMRIAENAGADVHKGRRMSLLPAPPDQTAEERDKEEKRKEREREAVKRKLEASRAKRNSRISVNQATPPPKPLRVGLLASAKSLVRNVWNMGVGGTNRPAAAPKAPATTVANPRGQSRIPSGSGSTLHKPTSSSAAKAEAAQTYHASTTSSGRSRPRIPSFSNVPSAPDSLASRNTQAIAQVATMHSTSTASHPPAKPSSSVVASSLGVRKNTVVPSSHMKASSLGARKSTAPTATQPPMPRVPSGSRPDTTNAGNRKRTVSKFMAPTASSLAKRGLLAGVVSRETTPQVNANANEGRPFASPITNNLHSPRSPRLQEIFSQPLDGFGDKSPLPHVPEKQVQAAQSLATAATTLMTRVPIKESENDNPAGQPSRKPPQSQLQQPKILVPRKPRISRSRIIAKLGAQRAGADTSIASTSTSASTIAPRPALSGKARSSISSVQRHSLEVKPSRVSGADVLMSAKKKARQSEMARRRSRMIAKSGAAVTTMEVFGAGSVDVSMDIDG